MDFRRIDTTERVKNVDEESGKTRKSQGKTREKLGNSVFKIWQTPCSKKKSFKKAEFDILTFSA